MDAALTIITRGAAAAAPTKATIEAIPVSRRAAAVRLLVRLVMGSFASCSGRPTLASGAERLHPHRKPTSPCQSRPRVPGGVMPSAIFTPPGNARQRPQTGHREYRTAPRPPEPRREKNAPVVPDDVPPQHACEP